MVTEVAAKKRTGGASTIPDAHGFTVVLEDLRGQFQVFGEALQGLRDRVEARFASVDRELGLVTSVLLEHGRQLTEIRQSVETIETNLDAKVDRTEVVTIVEGGLSKLR